MCLPDLKACLYMLLAFGLNNCGNTSIFLSELVEVEINWAEIINQKKVKSYSKCLKISDINHLLDCTGYLCLK